MTANRFLLNFLFFLQTLLIFLLVFESRISPPSWLNVMGRLHPAMVHLPIGFVSLFLLHYLFRHQLKKKAYYKISFFILLLTSLSAALSAIMGLFLSHQSDYESISLHKWSAVLFNFICYGVLILHQAKKLQSAIGVAAFVVLSAQVIVVGHSGGELTHGKGYVFAPLHKDEVSDPADQSAYALAVRPVLERKCFSCHNANKAKGKLIMTSAGSFLKGGKHGPAFAPGDVAQSRLIQNTLLPLQHDDHMPPDGKPQLTPEERKVLSYWIKSGASFTKPISDLAVDDSLRIYASGKMPSTEKRAAYPFEPAPSSVLSTLNTPFRVVFPLYKNSPALRADFFISEMYRPEALKELNQIKTQLVELTLSKMPVADADLETISGFINLEKLNLNFTNITGENLQLLSQLKNLKSLSLAGTPVKSEQLSRLSIPALRELFLWNTSVTPAQVAELKNRWRWVKIRMTDFKDEEILPLSMPALTKKDVWKANEKIELRHPMRGVVIRYTADGTRPDTASGKVYDQPFPATQTVRLNAIACKPGWHCSPVMEAICFVEGIKPASVRLLTFPDKAYSGEGATTLTDGKLGLADQYKEPMWLGYRGEALQVVVSFKSPQVLKTISISYAKNTPSYLFPPAKVEVLAADGNSYRPVAAVQPSQPTSYADGTKKDVIFVDMKGHRGASYKIVITPVDRLPSWHSGKGERSWVFVDEIFFN